MYDKFSATLFKESEDNSSSSLASSISSLSVGSRSTNNFQALSSEHSLEAIEEDHDQNGLIHVCEPSNTIVTNNNANCKAPNPITDLNDTETHDSEEINIQMSLGKYELGPHQPKNQRDIDRRSIYVSNIPFKISPWKLKQLFSKGTDTLKGCGIYSVNRVTILCDRYTGLPKGYAYIEFATVDVMDTAIQFNGLDVDGRIISVVRKRTNIPHISDSSKNNFKLGNKKIFTRMQRDNDDQCQDGNKNQANNNSRTSKNNIRDHKANKTNQSHNHEHNCHKDEIIPDSTRHNGFNNFSKYNSNHNSNNNIGFTKYKNTPSNSHNNSNYAFMGYPDRDRCNMRGRDHQRGHYGGNRGRGGRRGNNSNFPPLKTSKLIIDDNHYLTPSSRVGVYNRIDED